MFCFVLNEGERSGVLSDKSHNGGIINGVWDIVFVLKTLSGRYLAKDKQFDIDCCATKERKLINLLYYLVN